MREAAVKLQNLNKDLKIFSTQGRENTFGPQQNYTSTAPLIRLDENKQWSRWFQYYYVADILMTKTSTETQTELPWIKSAE